jgi:uncharacterized protein
MAFRDPPPQAAWRHQEALDGFEVVLIRAHDGGWLMEGDTAAVEEGEAYAVRYAIDVDAGWSTRRAHVTSLVAERRLETDGAGNWLVDGERAPHLDGIFDVDVESSALTNAFPVHRLGLKVGEEADAPAAYVRALDLRVERLEQHYVRLEDVDGRQTYRYASPEFGFEARLVYDESGLVLDYPGIAVRFT